jgi:hypothetical protein
MVKVKMGTFAYTPMLNLKYSFNKQKNLDFIKIFGDFTYAGDGCLKKLVKNLMLSGAQV